METSLLDNFDDIPQAIYLKFPANFLNHFSIQSFLVL